MSNSDQPCQRELNEAFEGKRVREHLQLPISLQVLTPVRQVVGKWCDVDGVDEEKAALFVLAVIEVVTNVVRHAEITLQKATLDTYVLSTAHCLEVRFQYPGVAYTPPPPPDEVDMTDMPEGGFGNFIIHSACDAVLFDHQNGLNIVRLLVSTGAPD